MNRRMMFTHKEIRMRIYFFGMILFAAAGCRLDSPVDANPAAATDSRRFAGVAKPTSLFAGVRLTQAERKAMGRINRRYNEKADSLRRTVADPNGPIDAKTLGKLRVIRSAQLAEWRGVMTPDHVERFDRNKATRDQAMAALRAAHPSIPATSIGR
jgi:hypothetical protein